MERERRATWSDEQRLKYALGLSLLGVPRRTIMTRLETTGGGLTDPTRFARYLDRALGPGGPEHLMPELWECDPDELVDAAERLGYLSLLEELGVARQLAESLIRWEWPEEEFGPAPTDQSREESGTDPEQSGKRSYRPRSDLERPAYVTRAVLWADARRHTRFHGEADLHLEPDVVEQSFGLAGKLLLGDGRTRYEPPSGAPATIKVVYRDPERPWTPYNDSFNRDALDGWFGWAAWAQGWIRVGLAEGSLSASRVETPDGRRGDAAPTKSAWNGPLLRLRDLTQTDDFGSHTLVTEPTSYVAQQATSFLFGQWKAVGEKFESPKTRVTAIDQLARMIDWREQEGQALEAASADPTIGELERQRAFEKALHLRHDVGSLRETIDRLSDADFPRRGLGAAGERRRAELGRAYGDGRLAGSRLANALSNNLAVVSRDGKLFVQRRNKEKVGAGFVDWQTTAAGFVNPEADLDDARVPSPWRGMGREAREEFGDTLTAPVLGLFWEARSYELGLLAFHRSTLTSSEIRVPPVESTEVKGFLRIEFTAKSLFEFACDPDFGGATSPMPTEVARTGPWANVMPLGAAAMLFALVHDAGGTPDDWRRLADAFRRVRDRYQPKD